MEKYQARLVVEQEELSDKISKLDFFVNNRSEFFDLDSEMQQLMVEQLAVMKRYSEILIKRIELEEVL